MAIAEINKPPNRFFLSMFNIAVNVCGLTNAMINPLTTMAGSGTTSLEGLIRSRTVHEQYTRLREQCADAANAAASARLNLVSDAAVGTADTIANLRNVIAGNDTNITNVADTSTFAFPI